MTHVPRKKRHDGDQSPVCADDTNVFQIILAIDQWVICPHALRRTDPQNRVNQRHHVFTVDVGAYAISGARSANNTLKVATGPYKIPNAVVDCYAVYTNKPPSSPYRGLPTTQHTMSYESQFDRIAKDLGIDRVELRKRNLVHEGDLFGIISTGPSSLSIDMTYDRQVLTDAINRITGDGFSVRELVMQQEGTRGPTEVRYRAHVAFKTAREVLRNLEQVHDRRKVFIYLSNGYDFNPFPDSRLFAGGVAERRRLAQDRLERGEITSQEFDSFYGQVPDPLTDPFTQAYRQGQQFANTDLAVELAELTRVANRANTSFYTVDPRGLMAGPNIDERVPIEEWSRYAFQTQNSLRMLAELTGGMAIVNRNDFARALREIDAETSDYYMLGFYTSNPDPTVRNRTLRVEVAGRDDLAIRARTHYSMPRPPG